MKADQLLKYIRTREASGPFEISAAQLAVAANADSAAASTALDALTAGGELKKEVRFVCPCDRAERLVDAGTVCEACSLAFGSDVPGRPEPTAFYRYEAPRNRDVRWMIALHGMNTDGAWQEEFMWRVSRTYGYSVPVAIYKYGVVRPGAVLKFRQRALTKGLIERIKRLGGEAENSGFPGPPDIIAHSLGTWLLGHALVSDENLRVGRVILVGCILRPDFNWRALIDAGRVQAVLCHHSASDFWARVAHYVIPDSGPSGRVGFNDRETVVNHGETDFGHGDYFLPAQMPRIFEALWAPFLTRAAPRLAELRGGQEQPLWKQAPWLVRATAPRFLVLLIALALCLFMAAAMLVGIYTVL